MCGERIQTPESKMHSMVLHCIYHKEIVGLKPSPFVREQVQYENEGT